MTTKEEKARLINIALSLKEVAEELMFISGAKKEKVVGKGEFKTPKAPKKEEPTVGEVKGPMKIGDLNIGDEGIVIEGEILELAKIAGTTKAGNPYEKASITISDGSGPIKLVLWNEQVEQLGDLAEHDVVKVMAWKVEKGYKGGVHELVYGKFGSIERVKIERHII